MESAFARLVELEFAAGHECVDACWFVILIGTQAGSRGLTSLTWILVCHVVDPTDGTIDGRRLASRRPALMGAET